MLQADDTTYRRQRLNGVTAAGANAELLLLQLLASRTQQQQ